MFKLSNLKKKIKALKRNHEQPKWLNFYSQKCVEFKNQSHLCSIISLPTPPMNCTLNVKLKKLRLLKSLLLPDLIQLVCIADVALIFGSYTLPAETSEERCSLGEGQILHDITSKRVENFRKKSKPWSRLTSTLPHVSELKGWLIYSSSNGDCYLLNSSWWRLLVTMMPSCDGWDHITQCAYF